MIDIYNLKVNLSGKNIINFKGKIKINDKSKVAILGENGAGKSTLIKTILGEYKPSSGYIKSSFTSKDTGVVFQTNSYNKLIKVKELIKLVFPKWGKNDVINFLLYYQLNNLKNSLVKNLSTGELQRLTLGLTISQNNSLYIFDELTSGLDSYKREHLLKLMFNKTNDSTVINISHNFDEIENWADTIIIMKMGKILFKGSKKELLTKYKHIGAIKTQNKLEYNKLPFSNTGNGYMYYINSKNDGINLKNYLYSHNINFSYIYPSVYTCYLLAYMS